MIVETLREKNLIIYADKEKQKIDQNQSFMGASDQYTTVDFGEMTKRIS